MQVMTFLCSINCSEIEASIVDIKATFVDVEANIYDFKARFQIL